MVRVGIIGCGRIADLHHLGYAEEPRAEVVAVCDVDADAVARRRDEWRVAKGYQDYRELLADPEIDAVEILTPQTIHEPMAIAAIEAGKHVAVQKPMTIGLESANRMIAAARRASSVFKVTDNYVFYPPIRLAKTMIDAGDIGEPIMMRMKFIGGLWHGGWHVPEDTWAWRQREAAQGRGVQTFDHGHHMWATAQFLLGPVDCVSSWIDFTGDFVDCPAVIMWKYKDLKRYGVCDYTQAVELPIPSKYYSCDEWFEITGSRGIILIRRCTGNLLDGPPVSVFDGERWKHHDVESDWASGFRYALRNFIAAIHGDDQPLLTGAQARDVLRFGFALRKSADRRREVYLDELDRSLPGLYAWKRRRQAQRAMRAHLTHSAESEHHS
ncbi:MAG TPA: Gfo/Idh/MocA family oxidoreductase [Candidatus Hydrogenedentes bacterium]|nr:Gfo/Idh/MocA family oxidoreductase [Candidatus Hydrogenedentota bacterium]HPG68332.1 Gfo/Idh/MocA family oxidoreductase [Candidatus Hydrogenedentota bacterium]